MTGSSWRRVDDNAIPARGKISGTYVNSALVKTDAERSGFDEAIVLNADGHISEGSAANVFLVRDGKVLTPPVTDNILEGIVRRTLIQLLGDEIGVGIAMALGLYSRLAALVTIVIMTVATYVHIVVADPSLFPLQPSEPIIPLGVIILCFYVIWKGAGAGSSDLLAS